MARRDGSAEIGTFTAPRRWPRRNSVSVRTSTSWGTGAAVPSSDAPSTEASRRVATSGTSPNGSHHGRRMGRWSPMSPGASRSPIIRDRMLRISWPLAFLLAAVIAIVARRPRLLGWVLVVFAIWFVVETVRARGRRR